MCNIFPLFYNASSKTDTQQQDYIVTEKNTLHPSKLLLCEISVLFIPCCILFEAIRTQQSCIQGLKEKLQAQQEEQLNTSRKGKGKKGKSKKKEEEEVSQGPTLEEQIAEISNKPLETFYSVISTQCIDQFFNFFD